MPLGAVAELAALQAGFWKDRDKITKNWKVGKRFEPKMKPHDREVHHLARWRRAIDSA